MKIKCLDLYILVTNEEKYLRYPMSSLKVKFSPSDWYSLPIHVFAANFT